MKRIQVPYIDQSAGYPTGCESVTAVMALNHMGCAVTADDFVDRFLPRGGFEERDSALFGPDPNEAFVGDPRDPESFGCYAPALKTALEAALKACGKGDALSVRVLTGLPTDRLLSDYIDRGIPVIYWASIDLAPPREGPSWLLPDGSPFTWQSNEHCMLLVGCEEDRLIFNDPWNNHGVIAYDRALAEKRHEQFWSMALAVVPR